MHSIEAKLVVTKFTEALRINDINIAIKTIERIDVYHFRANKHLMLIALQFANYMQKIVFDRLHPDNLEKLVATINQKFPRVYPAMCAEFIFYFQVVFDYTRAYSILLKISEAHEETMDPAICQYASVLCLQLKRNGEARSWLKIGRSKLETNKCYNLSYNTQISFDELEAQILQHEGKYTEAIAILKKIKCIQTNTDSIDFALARNYFLLGQYDRAENSIIAAISACSDVQNHLQYAQILFAMCRYDACINEAERAQIYIEDEWGKLTNTNEQHSEMREHLQIETYKLLVKASLKLGRPSDAYVYLKAAREVAGSPEIWRDITDLWQNPDTSFAKHLDDKMHDYAQVYPKIPPKAIFCIARADSITCCLSNLSNWYDAICRDYGLAFEIIVRSIVCSDDNTMSLENMVDYVCSKPGDALYGSRGLDILRKYRNRSSHTPTATAETAAESRRILFEEVLAKL